jgi:hypothetical protein
MKRFLRNLRDAEHIAREFHVLLHESLQVFINANEAVRA